jgi:hypothetical protein
MKFNREHLEELTLQKIKEVNDEAGYRSYLEVPEMVNIVASIIEEKFVDNRWEKCADRLFVYAMETLSTATNMALYEVAKEDILEYNKLKIREPEKSIKPSPNEPAWKSWNWPMYTPPTPRNNL